MEIFQYFLKVIMQMIKKVFFLIHYGIEFSKLTYLIYSILKMIRGTWVTQSVKCLTSAQVMISWIMSWSPSSGSVVSTEPTSDPLSPSLSAPPLLAL